MKKRLLWALLSWLSLLSFGARAQTKVLLAQENFEDGTPNTSPTYGYTDNHFFVTANNQYFQRQQLSASGAAYPGTTQPLINPEGSYAWTAEGVRGTGTQTTRSAGYVALRSVPTSGYNNFSMTVSFAEPAGPGCVNCSRNGVLASDRVRLQYSFDGSPFITAGILVNGSGGYWQQDTSTPLDSVADGTVIDRNFKDITARISGTGSSLRVRVVCDFRSPLIVFDNIRVYGDVNTVATPTLNGLETTAASYTEGGSPVKLTSSLTVGYSASPNLTGGTVNVSANFASGDRLNFTNQNDITGSYNTTNGILTLTGTASLATYETALRSITYSSDNTTNLNTGTRQITFQVQSGTAVSNTPVRALNITGVLNAAATLTYTEDFNENGDGTRYFGNTWADVSTARVGSFRATSSPASYNGTQIGEGVFTGWSGGYWFGEGTPTTANPTNPYGLVQLAPVNAAGRANIRFTVAIGSAGNWLGYINANNPGDQFELFYSTDGGTTLTKFGAFYGVDGTTPARQDADLDVLTPATGTQLSPALQDFTFTLPPAAAVSNLTFVLRQRSRGQSEIAYDNIRITGTSLPTVTTTTPATDIQATSATLGGTVTANGGGTLTERGVVYVAGTGTPTTSNTKAVVATSGIVVGTPFAGTVTGLTAGTQYTARAYATNEAGTSYGANVTFTTATTITSIALVDPSITNASQVRFTVTFASAITGLSSTNFSITANGTLAGVGVASISGSGTTYTVTVNTGSGSGSQLQLNLVNSTNLSPSVSNVPFKDASYSIDKTLPTVTISSSAGASGGSTSTSPIPFTVTFSEDVTGFAQGDLTVANGTIAGFTAVSGTVYTFSVRPATKTSTVTVNVLANVAQDQATNGNTASQYSLTFVAPTITVAPASLPIGTQGTAYTQSLSASGGTAPYTYDITGGALPGGLSLTNGTITGTPTANGAFNFTVTATDASTAPGPYSGSRSYTLVINPEPVTAAPVVTAPANGSLTNNPSPTYQGTAPAGSLVTVYVDNVSIGTTTATAGGAFSLAQPAALVQGQHSVYATAQTSGAAASPNSAANTFIVDSVSPSVAISSSAGASGNTTNMNPLAFTVAFSESVTGFSASGVTVSNGTISGFSGSGTTYTFNVAPTTAGTATTVNVPANVATDNAGNGNTAAAAAYALTLQTTIWTGGTSTDWYTAGNWTVGVPILSVDAIIPTVGTSRYPAVGAGTAQVRNLTVNSGATLNQNGGTIAIAANLTNNGTFRATGGTVSLGNTAFSNILGSGNIRFWNLTAGINGVQLSTSIGASVQRVLTLNGNFATNGNSFVLESNPTITALVVNNNSNVVNGTVTVQRYIDPSVNPGLGYRHYSTPVSNSTVGDLATSGFSPVVNPAYNTDATPYSVVPFPTVYGYDDSRLSLTNNALTFDKGFFSPAALSDPLTVGKGYTVNIAASEVVDFQGTLNNGDQTLNLTSTRNTYPDGGWQFLGNPYPAPLDYAQVAVGDRAGLESSIYVYSSTSQYQGRYRSYTNNIGNSVVPMGQGFFARVASGQSTATMTFRNSQRLTLPNGTTLQRTTADPRPQVQLTLQGKGAAPDDEAYVYFENGATSGYEPAFDAEKLANSSGFNLSTTQAGKQLSIDGQPELGTTQRVVPLAVGVPAAGVYTLAAGQLLNLTTTPTYLRDLQTGAVIDLKLQPSYQFTVSNASALITGRFELVFSPQQALATATAALSQQVALYPNPAKKAAFVELPASLGRQAVTASLVDALGRVVRTVSLPAKGALAHQLDLSELATGVYALRLSTSAGVVVKKLVIE